ncbi:MAG: hypothetical protein RIR70_319 [Pseudomonadota bacterium]|jgi:molybdopterin-biosynthesis enzyme MoeA-like protein
MKFSFIIIGDEILSGRRQDKHLAHGIATLKARGFALSRAMYLGDDREALIAYLKQSFATDDVVFSFGGIGVTPDDHTRQAAAAALGVPCVLHPDAEARIRERFGAEITPNRLKLGEFPKGARIIENPFNRIPGFAVGSHYFLPGFPEMAWPMMTHVLDTDYADIQDGALAIEDSMRVIEGQESKLLDLMESVEATFPGIKVFSLPSFGGADGARRHIELGAKGEPAQVKEAMAIMRAEVKKRGLEIEDLPPMA